MATATSLILNITSQYSQQFTDDTNANNISSDAGQISYQRTYNSGVISGTVNEVFHKIAAMASGGTAHFNLTGLTQSLLGYDITKSFSSVNSITFKNHSTRSGADININVSASSGFKDFFGFPTGSIPLKAGSCVHHNVLAPEYPVDVNHCYIQLVDAGSGATYEMVIGGHV